MPTCAQLEKEGKTPILINRMIVKYLHMLENVYNEILESILKEILSELET